MPRLYSGTERPHAPLLESCINSSIYYFIEGVEAGDYI
jgi:hypothetical protein